MALGNLSIKVNADIGGFTTSMDIARKAALEGMGASSGSVDDFRVHLLRASDDLERAARSMGGNMQAANDAIVSSSAQAAAAVQGVATSIEQVDTRSMNEKVAFAVGAGVGAGAAAGKTAINAFIDYLEAKLVIAALVILTGITAAVFSVIYLASKAVSTISAMMDGSFFKSENIDALIATNKELLDLQKNLRISAIEAGALNEAMKRLDVDKGDYKAVYEGVTKSIHENGEELDRLGVKYKDANGKFLESRQVIENVKGVLDGYTEGWDRNAAAAAIGIGAYDKIKEVLKVTSAEVQTSKERLDDYQLGVTEGSQKMVADYQQAMRDFDSENRLMAEGMKRVYADAVLPLFTDMANAFKDGWPIIVQATRAGVAGVMAAFYAFKTSIYIVAESILATVEGLGAALDGIGEAARRLKSGDVRGAAQAVADGWTSAKTRIKDAGVNIAAQMESSNRAIALAAATDGRSASIESAKLPAPTAGKAFVARPKTEQAAARGGPAGPIDDVAKRVMEGKLKVQEDFIADEKTLMQTREQFLKNYYAEDSISAAHYYTTSQLLTSENFLKVQAAYNKEIEAIQEYIKIHKTESDKKADIVNAENKIAEIRRKKAQEEIATNRDLALSYMALANERTSIANSLLRADQIEAQSYKRRTSVLMAFRDAQLGNKNEGNRLLEAEEKRHSDAMSNLQLSTTQNMLSLAQSSSSQLYDALKSAGLEQTALGKAMFYAQKAVQVATIIVNTEVAAAAAQAGMIASAGATAAVSGPAGPAILAAGISAGAAFATATRVMGYATAGIVAGTALAGAREKGGPVWSGGSFLVGEKGPEIFTPSSGGTIIPNDKIGGMSGSGGITIINNTSAKIGKVTEQRQASGDRALVIDEAVATFALQLADPNSRPSRAMSRHFNTARSR